MSGETKWTPGPWVIDAETRPAEVCTVYHTSHENGFVYVRGEMGYWGADENENWANAQLIAAAPDLYEALEEARGTIQALIDEGYTGHIDQRGRIDAALAKARGESQ